MILYEYPFNERIRTLLRLEDLFDRLFHFMRLTDPREHHVALVTLFDILEVASRADLKSDLLQELERQRQTWMSHRNHPQVDTAAVDELIGDIERTLATFGGMQGKTGQHLRENEWLMAVRSRSLIPGGACEFDLPAYHAWQHRDSEARTRDLYDWATPFLPLRDAVTIVLRLLREQGTRQSALAVAGNFQQNLGGKVAQLLRVRIGEAPEVYPEISANKYMISIRFFRYEGPHKSLPLQQDVPIELMLCSL